MKSLLRSVFVADSGDSDQLLLKNYQLLNGSGLGFDVPEYNAIWAFIVEFVRAHSHVPNITTIRSYFEHSKEDTVLDQLVHLEGLKARTKGDFQRVLEDKANDRRQMLWSETLKMASVITSTGAEVVEEGLYGRRSEKKFLKGPVQSARYVVERAHDVVAPTIGGRLSGEVTKDGVAVREEYERVESDPLAGIGQFCFLKQCDDALSGAKRHELWIHAAFTGGLKCISGDTRIFDLKTGCLRTAREIYLSGDAPIVSALDGGSWEMAPAQASSLVQNGIRPILKVQSETGRQIRVSDNHPFLTPSGWVEAGNLSVGDWVAVPGSLANDNQDSPFSDEEVAAIGYLLGDGHIKNDISFTNGNLAIMEDFVRCLEQLGYQESIAESKARFPAYRYMNERPGSQMVRVSKSTGDSPRHPWASYLRNRLEGLGLWGCTSGDKHIPLKMWRMTDAQVWILISALWATDGSISVDATSKTRKPKPVAYYTTKSRQLAWDIQALLQRVGVPSTVSETKVRYQGEKRVYWSVLVTTNEGKRRFFSCIRVAGKEQATEVALAATPAAEDTDWMPPSLLTGLGDNVRARTRKGGWHYVKWARRKGKIQRDTLVRLAKASGDIGLLRKATGDVRWERLTEVSPDGTEMTYDLSVPGPANFVANGFITHNSTYMLNWAYNQAVIYQHNCLIFSLEMPYSQCRRILYAIHSMHPKFREIRMRLGIQRDLETDIGLNYQDIRDGTLEKWHDNAKAFYFEYVIPDFNGDDVVKHPYLGCDYGSIHIEVADPDKDDFTMHDLRSMAEVIYSKDPFQMIFVDHVGLMSPRRHRNSTTENLNEVVRDLKKLALGFNRGQGMAVVGLFQISREGYKSALKAKEKTGKAGYNLTHLSYANECCKWSELLRFSDGVRPISTAKLGDRVWSSTGWREILGVFDQGVHPIWRVGTDRGSYLDCTANHRVRVIRDEKLAWSRVDALQLGDFVVGSYGGAVAASAPLPSSWKSTNSLTDDLAYLLGAWHGDGRVRPNSLGFTGNRREVTLEAHLAKVLFRVHESKEPAVYHHKSRPGSFDMELYDTRFKHWFEKIAGVRGQEIPAAVWGAPTKQVCLFLKGLFDTDGGINRIGVISVASKHEAFLRQVQGLLTQQGIDSYLGSKTTTLKKTGRTYKGWYLNIRGWGSVVRFASQVGFTPERKRQRLAAKMSRPPRMKRSDQIYPFPQMFAALVKERLPYRLISKGVIKRSLHNKVKVFLDRGTVSEDTIRYVLNTLISQGVVDSRADFLRQVLTTWQVMRVTSVGPTGEEAPVWDIEVGGDHEYQTGPLLSHNCERSADVVTATWIDDELRNQSRVQFDCLKSRDQAKFMSFIARVEWHCRRLLSCFDAPLTPEENAKMGAEVDAAAAELEDD